MIYPAIYQRMENMPIDKLQALLWTASAALLLAQPAAAAQRGMDCPSAFEPYSSNSLLYDLIINPATRAVLEKDGAALVKKIPPTLMPPAPQSPNLPNFTVLVSPRSMAKGAGLDESVLEKLDAGLKAVPVTREAAVARCARYDETPPELPREFKQPAVLVFTKITGFHHGPAVDAANAAIEDMGDRRGWTAFFTDNGAVFNPKALKRFNAVIWNNVSGDVLTLTQQRAFRAYIENGGGFAAFHGSAGDPKYLWDWYADTLIGARFVSHTMAPQFPDGKVVVENPKDALVRDLGEGWTMPEEWYSFKPNPRQSGVQVLATLDESSYLPSQKNAELRMGDHPIAWKRCVENGRSFYTAIGHRPESYAEPHTAKLLEASITWAAGLGETQCRKGQEISTKH